MRLRFLMEYRLPLSACPRPDTGAPHDRRQDTPVESAPLAQPVRQNGDFVILAHDLYMVHLKSSIGAETTDFSDELPLRHTAHGRVHPKARLRHQIRHPLPIAGKDSVQQMSFASHRGFRHH